MNSQFLEPISMSQTRYIRSPVADWKEGFSQKLPGDHLKIP